MNFYFGKKNKRKGLALLLGSITVFSLEAQDSSYAMSVKKAVDYANKNSLQVRNALMGIDLQRAQNKEITASAYPQLTGSAGTNYYPNVAVQSFPNFIGAATYGVLVQEGVKNGSGGPIVAPTDFGLIAAQFGTKYNASAGLDFSQLLFDGQVFAGLQARRTSISYAAKTADVTKEQIKTNIYKIYYQLVAGRKQISTIDANISRIDKLYTDTKEIYKNGFAEKLDVSKVEVSLTNLKTEKLKLETQLQSAYLGLKLLMGMPVKDQLILTDTLPEQLFIEEVADTPYNYTDRVEYEQLMLNKKLNEYNIKRYKLSYLPTVSLSSSYYEIAQRNQFNFFKSGLPWFRSSSVGLHINVPIFDGFAKAARVQTAKLQLEITQNNLQSLRQSVDKEVEEARINIRTSLASMEFQKKNMGLAETVYDQTKLKFEQGLGSNTEITTAQSELTIAQNNFYSALYDAIIARIDYLRATGKL